MSDEPKIIHISRRHKDPLIPDAMPDECPKCHVPPEIGFGLAGGGMGVYSYCPNCGDMLSKTETE